MIAGGESETFDFYFCAARKSIVRSRMIKSAAAGMNERRYSPGTRKATMTNKPPRSKPATANDSPNKRIYKMASKENISSERIENTEDTNPERE